MHFNRGKQQQPLVYLYLYLCLYLYLQIWESADPEAKPLALSWGTFPRLSCFLYKYKFDTKKHIRLKNITSVRCLTNLYHQFSFQRFVRYEGIGKRHKLMDRHPNSLLQIITPLLDCLGMNLFFSGKSCCKSADVPTNSLTLYLPSKGNWTLWRATPVHLATRSAERIKVERSLSTTTFIRLK